MHVCCSKEVTSLLEGDSPGTRVPIQGREDFPLCVVLSVLWNCGFGATKEVGLNGKTFTFLRRITKDRTKLIWFRTNVCKIFFSDLLSNKAIGTA